MKVFSIIFFLFISSLLYSQQFAEPKAELIFTDNTPDSIFIKLSFSDKGFDKNGNYFFEVRKDKMEFIYTKDTVIGPLNGGGEVNSEFFTYNTDSLHSLHRKKNGKTIYGPYVTDNRYSAETYSLSPNTDTLASIEKFDDKYYFYLNNKLIFTTSMSTDEPYWFDKKQWVAFGFNGDILHVEYKDGIFNLFKNSLLIDSSPEKITKLAINGKGEFVYVRQKEYLDEAKTKLNVLLKFKDKEFLSQGYCDDAYVDNNGNFMFEGATKNGNYIYEGYIMVNGYYKSGFNRKVNLIVENDTNFFYLCYSDKDKFFAHGTTEYKNTFDTIYYPSVDTIGNFAMFGKKDFYIYKYINGVKDEYPITKDGVRPEPIYISATGDAIYYYRVKDSVFVYRNEERLFSSKRKNFISENLFESYLSPLHYKKKNNYRFLSLQYLQIDSTGYVLYNGKLSEKLIPFREKESYDSCVTGQVVLGGIYENKFYFVQYQGNGKFLIDINNSTYGYIDDFDEIFTYDNEYFDGQNLIFYGRKGRDFFKINLTDE